MGASRASWGSLWPLGLAVAVLLAAGGAWGQTTWTKYEGNPVLAPGAPGEWDAGGVGPPAICFDGATFHLWYGGNPTPEDTDADIGYATSPDGVSWTKHPANPVLERGEAGAWDSAWILPSAALWDGVSFHLWYSGACSPPCANPDYQPVGYATSPDGVTWTRHPANPVLTPGGAGSWDADGLWMSAVLAEGGTFRAWYRGGRWGPPVRADIGYATSPDGVTWTEYAGNPVLSSTGSGWDGRILSNPFVVRDGDLYHMWYSGFGTNNGIGHAVSADGLHWARQPASAPDLERGGEGAFDEALVECPEVLVVGDTAHMWYTAGSADDVWSVGYATAPLPFPEPPLLLQGGRFLVESMWWTSDGRFGYGDPYPLTDDSGAFTFFDPANIELLVKVLDGCAISQRYWVFIAGLTDVGVTVTVTDTETGQQKIYNSTLGVPFAPILDTDAFALCE